jgi:hypothetical protein
MVDGAADFDTTAFLCFFVGDSRMKTGLEADRLALFLWSSVLCLRGMSSSAFSSVAATAKGRLALPASQLYTLTS